jgi:hypothetical protein
MFVRYTPKQLSFLKSVLPSINLKAFQIGIYNEVLRAFDNSIDEKNMHQLVDKLKKEEQLELYNFLKKRFDDIDQITNTVPQNPKPTPAKIISKPKVSKDIVQEEKEIPKPIPKKELEPIKEETEQIEEIDDENIEESIDNTIEEIDDTEELVITDGIQEEKVEEESDESTDGTIEETTEETEYKVYDGSEDDDDCIFGTIDKRQNKILEQNKEQSKYI